MCFDVINVLIYIPVQHSHLFPRSFGEIISRYEIEELHLSLTEGLWRHVNWGYPVVDAPPGAELYVWFSKQSTNIDEQWKELTETLSGLFCASLNFINLSNSFSPQMTFRPSGVTDMKNVNNSYIRYASLPREIVCTENLTPWKKLLPCDSKSGLATLLNSGKLHNTNYHSLGIHFRSICADSSCKSKTYELKQTMSLVFNPDLVNGRERWSIQRLFGYGIGKSCPLAQSSFIYVDLTQDNKEIRPQYDYIQTALRGASNLTLAVYDLKKVNTMFNIEVVNKKPIKVGVPILPPLHANRYIGGYGQERGSVMTQVYNNHWMPINIIFLENIPWFLPVYLQTLKIISNGKILKPVNLKYIPGKGKIRPYYLEFGVSLPPKSTTKISIDFDYMFLKWQEYPPDANHGFYVGSATITALLPTAKNFTTSILYPGTFASSLNSSKSGYIVQLHTESMIITLPTPDFSMPYNVICLACTVVALAFGPIHNITTKSLQLKLLPSKEDGTWYYKILNKILRKKQPVVESTSTNDEDNKKDCDSEVK